MAQQPQQTTGAQGGQMGQMGQAGGQQGLTLQDVQSPQERAAIQAISQAIEVCGFCADQCIQLGDPHMAECIRLCEDVVELGETSLAMLGRNSRYSSTVLQAFGQAAQACAQECGQHSHAHCQECASVLPGTINATQQLVQPGGQGAW